MIVSTKGRYALRVMVYMALKNTGEFIPLKEIAEAESISQKYLEAIMTTLSKADFVDAVHGKGGGYRLNRAPEKYSVGSILKLTEGSLNVASCTAQGAAACSRSECCHTLPMWERLDRMIDEFFEGITLADLLREAQAKNNA
jgi:Rrf2 family protein